MQVKFFTIPIIGGEVLAEELNAFLRSRKILEVEKQVENNGKNIFWCFCITYIESSKKGIPNVRKEKINYKEVLDAASFSRFSKMREIRKRIAKEEAIPAYSVFIDAELAALAKVEKLTLTQMKTIKGVGEKKVEKYGKYFVEKKSEDEKS